MPKDYASRSSNRSNSKKSGKRTNAAKPKRRASGNHGVLFHGPSFTTGAIVGAAIVILTAYGPELLQSPSVPAADNVTGPSEERSLIFEFDTLLKDTEVQADPETYAVPESLTRGDRRYTIQAASFRSFDDAEKLRAALMLENLEVRTEQISASSGTWYRVLVGPFTRKVDADRAMTKLRQRNLSAIPVNDHD